MARRSFLAAFAAGALPEGILLGVPDWMIKQVSRPEAFAFAHRMGLDGVEISLSGWKKRPIEKMVLDDDAVQALYRGAVEREGCRIAATCLDLALVQYPLKNDPAAPAWLSRGIAVTAKMGARVMIVPCAGPSAMTNAAEIDRVTAVLKEQARDAERAGVVIGLEDLVSSEQNARILDRVGSPAVRVFYDVGNSHLAGFDVVKEIRWLGRERICQFHFKDRDHYLGEGPIDFPAVVAAVRDIRYRGFISLESTSPSGAIESDLSRNLRFVRELWARS